jgi:hypothetical protein
MAILAALAAMLGKGAAGATAGGVGAGGLAAAATEAGIGAGLAAPAAMGLGNAAAAAAPATATIGSLLPSLSSLPGAESFKPFLSGAKEGMGIYGILKQLMPPGAKAAPPTLPSPGGGGRPSPVASPSTQALLQAAMQRRGQSGPEALIARLLQGSR